MKENEKNEIHEYYLSNSLAFSEIDVFKKIFSIEKYKKEKHASSQSDYEIDKKEYYNNPENKGPYPEYVNPYQGYTDEQFYQLLKEERVAMLHSVEAGQWNKELHFIYDLEKPTLNCSSELVNEEGFVLSCKITYSFPESAVFHIEQNKSLDIKLDFSHKEGYRCDATSFSQSDETISKTCLIKSRSFSLISSLESDSHTIIVRSDTLGTVLTDEASEFRIQDGNITQTTNKN